MRVSEYGVRSSYILNAGVPHLVQQYSWDCGLACLKMALRYLNPSLGSHDLENACKEHGLGHSVWTIDLAYLCKILGVRHDFFTQTFGVNHDYVNEAFYKTEMQSNFSDEELRVNALFDRSEESGVNVHKASVGVSEILRHLAKEQILIVLVNDKEFRSKSTPNCDEYDLCCFGCCEFSAGGYSGVETQNMASTEPSGEGYWGHYVVVVGYDISQKVFIVNDPSNGGEHIRCSFDTLERARKSFGTDEDILFLYSS